MNKMHFYVLLEVNKTFVATSIYQIVTAIALIIQKSYLE